MPTKAGGTEDWGTYPRAEKNSDLCTMRVDPAESHGLFVATKPAKPGVHPAAVPRRRRRRRHYPLQQTAEGSAG